MSQLGVSRPQSFTERLPQIPHPLSQRGSADNLDIRGVSRSGPHDRPSSILHGPTPPDSGRPLGHEEAAMYRTPKRSAHGPSPGKQSRASSMKGYDGPQIDTIPEDIAVMHGEAGKTKLPLFGRSAEIGANRGNLENRASSRLSTSSSKLRLEIDELEALLKEKVKNNYSKLKKSFKDNDPDQKGNVTRDALFRILVTTLNAPMNPSQFKRLTERIGLAERQIINHIDFFSAFRSKSASEYPRWMDPIQRQSLDRSAMNASQVHAQLLDKARQKVKDIADLIPQSNPDGTGHILKPEFRNVLNKMGYCMEDDEFDKLWCKYDVNSSGAINGEKLMQKLGISIAPASKGPTPRVDHQREISAEQKRADALRKHAEQRQRSLDIERFLKDKFRAGFTEMRTKFEAKDSNKTGNVTHEAFLDVLEESGLSLDKDHLAEFLSRCSVQPTRTHVPYREFLHRFQDRSEDGMAHSVLTNPKHRYHCASSPADGSTMGSLEAQLISMFQQDFLALLGTFHNIDKLGEDAIPQEAFRAAIESRFHLELTDEQFDSLIDQVPLNEDGAVKYAEFMAQFDTKGRAKSLFSEPAQKKYKSIGPLPREPSPPAPEILPEEVPPSPPADVKTNINRLVIHEEGQGAPAKRTPKELFKVIKGIMRKDYHLVEQRFQDMDEMNTGRLTQEAMFQLFSKFDVDPAITRGEIRDLWKTFITNQDKTLDFLQFTRHFGYSLKSAAFPNAKSRPPVRGDSDCLIRSRKLNCAADMLQDNLRAKIDYMWDQLRQEFQELDPYNTGYIMPDEFRTVLSELCVHLTVHELESLVSKFDISHDGRVSYVEFLKPFAQKKQLWRVGNDMSRIVAHADAKGVPENKSINAITTKVKVKAAGDWKGLRRSFKKADSKNEGSVTLNEFRTALKSVNINLDNEEIYQIMSHFDSGLTGKLEYNKFLSSTFNLGEQGLRKSFQI